MMGAAPSAAFVMSEPEFLLEILVVALDAPAMLGEIDQTREADVVRQGRQPVFRRLGRVLRPFDQQPLFGARGQDRDGRRAPATARTGRSAGRPSPRAT